MTGPRPPEHVGTARTFLRPVTPDDAEAMFRGYANSPAATSYMVWPRQTSIDRDGFAARCARAWQESGAYPWAVILRESNTFVGVIELRINPPKADFGYIFCEPFWGQGSPPKS